VTFGWPNVSYGNGFLYAVPGLGSIQVKDSETVGQLLAGQGAAASAEESMMGQVKERITLALKDFEYSVLKIEFVNSEKGLSARVHCEGKGLKNKQPFIFDLNLNGIKDVFDNFLVIEKIKEGLIEQP
jgi:hypothetical protein